jgi:glycosyltransferase involved in cell wall biosynthesis
VQRKGKVLVVTSVFPRWEGDSTPPFVQNQCEQMVDAGWSIEVLAPHSSGAKFRETVNGVRIYRYPYMFPWGLQQLCYNGGMLINLQEKPWTKVLLPFLYLAQVIALLLVCIRLKPDLLHSHSLLPQGLSACLIGRLLRIPHITTSHGNDVFGLKPNGLMGALKRFVLSKVDAVTVNSSATRDAVLKLGVDVEKLELIPAVPNEAAVEGSILAQINAVYGKSKRILFVGRLIQEKGVFELLHAFAQLRVSMSDLQCFIVGAGVEREKLEALASELSITSCMHFIGWQPREDIPSWMAASDVLVVPSWREAQGLVIAEAMAAGTVVVAANVGGVPDMIRDGETGCLCDAQSVDNLVNALERALLERNNQELKARALQLYEKEYSRGAVAAKTEYLYERVLEQKGGRTS